MKKRTGFANCATGRTVSTTWACRAPRRAMVECMVARATLDEQDAARAEWFATRLVRQREREARERRRVEQEKFHREWWGMPPLPDGKVAEAGTGAGMEEGMKQGAVDGKGR